MSKLFKSSLGSREKGKIAEFHVISRLVASELDVYTPIVDIGIDCIIRVQKHHKPIKYYELQIKDARDEDVSIRGAQKIVEYVEMEDPKDYYLIVPLRRNGEYQEIIYLTKEQIKKWKTKQWNKEQDIRIPAQEKDKLVEEQPLDKLLQKMKSNE